MSRSTSRWWLAGHQQTYLRLPAEQLFRKVGPPYDADNMYGWAKLMGEMTLRAYYRDWGMKSASCRYFTVYGPREHLNHAVIAMIARSFVDQDPFVVWGNGEQIRNWTHVGDIVEGTLLAAEKIEDGTAVNLGTNERTRVIDAVREVLRYTDKDHLPEINAARRGIDDFLHVGSVAGVKQHAVQSEVGCAGGLVHLKVPSATMVGCQMKNDLHLVDGTLGDSWRQQIRPDKLHER